jgi:hypothetical protein
MLPVADDGTCVVFTCCAFVHPAVNAARMRRQNTVEGRSDRFIGFSHGEDSVPGGYTIFPEITGIVIAIHLRLSIALTAAEI